MAAAIPTVILVHPAPVAVSLSRAIAVNNLLAASRAIAVIRVYIIVADNGFVKSGCPLGMRRCAASFVIAAYHQSTPHSSGFARLAYELFTKPSGFVRKSFYSEDGNYFILLL